ncbi:hypothetical protein Mycch_3122 [Mycolicibacterium chubuense NBB4]|uniref:Alkylmercury lyase n=1 Tax=Mycolicibacterium chubuense (strain NBB4) TaxID=710421 RepID=I4BKR5_MYCCN|nr:alkylmercury lyase [Mycolicibacterium chubuense]AFM17872.1 hypothetical protein Mycch_3122 [Mycolicibacterium chubuense NBB4]
MRIDLLRHPGCAHAEQVRRLVDECLSAAGCDALVVDTVGDYPSPTVLVDGKDVVTGGEAQRGRACRLDLPTRERLLEVLIPTNSRRGPVEKS